MWIGLQLLMAIQVIAFFPAEKEQTPPRIIFRIGMISDLEENSKSDTEPNTWISYLKKGNMTYDFHLNEVTVSWDDKDNGEEYKSHNWNDDTGRGFELSELATFYGRLFTVDDQTGVVYIYDTDRFLAWKVIREAKDSSTAMKIEWTTVKDNVLYVGSTGRDKSSSGVAIIDKDGNIEYTNWEKYYAKLRKSVDIQLPGYVDNESCIWSHVYRHLFFLPRKTFDAKPGRAAATENNQKTTHLNWEEDFGNVRYMTHEACVWSEVHQRVFFLPRKASTTEYNEKEDSHKGTNILLSATVDFDDIQVKTIGINVPDRGYSSFKFVPHTDDKVIAAILTTEKDDEESNITPAPKITATYLTVFTVDGEIIYEQTKVSDLKFEGLEFI
ncbi:Apyrase,Six-bladed beta-propeller, TolB-like [Cinara cedri]|uniref:Apyrase,Six-bladed beta-propeller, TolB-like n=1 Tax=Cinara cedri TaxID=506608 RepID=A0A5E4NT62_9HEMI|nr:Apyrase,Six-bladed beta-propeller, TolB-like [Cinara cedri]